MEQSGYRVGLRITREDEDDRSETVWSSVVGEITPPITSKRFYESELTAHLGTGPDDSYPMAALELPLNTVIGFDFEHPKDETDDQQYQKVQKVLCGLLSPTGLIDIEFVLADEQPDTTA